MPPSRPREEEPSPREEAPSPREEPSSPREKELNPREEPSSPREEAPSPRDEPSSPRGEPSISREEASNPREEEPSLSEEPSSPGEELPDPREELPGPREAMEPPAPASHAPARRGTARPPAPLYPCEELNMDADMLEETTKAEELYKEPVKANLGAKDMSFELIIESLKYGALGHSALYFGSLDFGAKVPEELQTKDDKRLQTTGLVTDQLAESALPPNQQLDLERPRPGHPASYEMGAQLPGHARVSQADTGRRPSHKLAYGP